MIVLFFLETPEQSEETEETKETPFLTSGVPVDVTYNIRHVEEAWLHLLNAGK